METIEPKDIGIIGAGGQVSLGVMQQIADKAAQTSERITLLIDSRQALIKPEGIPTKDLQAILKPGFDTETAKAKSKANVKNYMGTEGAESYQTVAALLESIQQDGLRPRLLDVSSMSGDAAIAAHLKSQALGLIMSTANKNPGAFSTLEEYQAMLACPEGQYSDEVACMAGAGVLGYLEGRHRAGDKILSLEGSYSGTLTFIFSNLEAEIRREIESGGDYQAKPFSSIVAEAQAAGFTEPHPAEDLNLIDMAKKMELHNKKLGREVGVDQVEIKGFIPDEINAITDISAYLKALKAVDRSLHDHMHQAVSEGKTLRVVGVIDEKGRTSVEIKELGLGHPVAQLKKALNGTQVISDDRGTWKLTALGAGITETATSVREQALKFIT